MYLTVMEPVASNVTVCVFGGDKPWWHGILSTSIKLDFHHYLLPLKDGVVPMVTSELFWFCKSDIRTRLWFSDWDWPKMLSHLRGREGGG